MAEAAGLITAATEITSLLKKTISFCKSVNHAPEEIQRLLHDIELVNSLVLDIGEQQKSVEDYIVVQEPRSSYLKCCQKEASALHKLVTNLSNSIEQRIPGAWIDRDEADRQDLWRRYEEASRKYHFCLSRRRRRRFLRYLGLTPSQIDADFCKVESPSGPCEFIRGYPPVSKFILHESWREIVDRTARCYRKRRAEVEGFLRDTNGWYLSEHKAILRKSMKAAP